MCAIIKYLKYWETQVFQTRALAQKEEESGSLLFSVASVGQFIGMIYFYISTIFQDKTWVNKDSKHKITLNVTNNS